MKHLKFFLITIFSLLLISCSNQNRSPLTIICIGDSITESSYGNYPVILQKIFLKNKIKAKIISLGRSGNTSGEYLRFLKIADPLRKQKANIVIIMLGTNDVRIDGDHTPTPLYIENMLKIIGRVRSQAVNNPDRIKIFIATIPPIFVTDLYTFNKDSVKRVREEIVPAIKKIAVENDLILIDINRFFNDNRSLLPGIHPSPAGYFKMAKFIFKNLAEHMKQIQPK